MQQVRKRIVMITLRDYGRRRVKPGNWGAAGLVRGWAGLEGYVRARITARSAY